MTPAQLLLPLPVAPLHPISRSRARLLFARMKKRLAAQFVMR